MSPQRVQRRRVAGQPGIPAGARYVGRPGKWGNPVRIGHWVSAGSAWRDGGRCTVSTFPRTAADLVLYYQLGLRHGGLVIGGTRGEDRRPVPLPSLDDIRQELAGLDLACWCPLTDENGQPVPCHAAVLLSVAAGADPLSAAVAR